MDTRYNFVHLGTKLCRFSGPCPAARSDDASEGLCFYIEIISAYYVVTPSAMILKYAGFCINVHIEVDRFVMFVLKRTNLLHLHSSAF